MIISKMEFLFRSHLDQETLQVWIEEEWLVPQVGEPDFTFTEADVARAQLILDLKKDLGVNDEGIGVNFEPARPDAQPAQGIGWKVWRHGQFSRRGLLRRR
jgi:chaperone modulatory protein CbpM